MLQKFFDDLGAAFSSDQMRLLVQIPWIRHIMPELCGWNKWKEVVDSRLCKLGFPDSRFFGSRRFISRIGKFQFPIGKPGNVVLL